MTLREETLNFMTLLNELPDREYLASVIAYGTAPTVRGEKPSSLMTFTRNGRSLYDLWNTFKMETAEELKLEFMELNDKKDSVRVLFYKRELLEECINKKECREFLNSMGYRRAATLEECLHELKLRFERICPHEIGVFLGIPVEDVAGFISYKGVNSILCRYWKVYHNPDAASMLFESYDRAREHIRKAIGNRYNKYEHKKGEATASGLSDTMDYRLCAEIDM